MKMINFLRYTSTIFFMLMLISCSWSQETATELTSPPLQVYLAIGQSNMAGRAAVPEDKKAALERCVLLNTEGEWTSATHPFNHYSTVKYREGSLSPAYGFARKMLESDPEVKIGLVVNARGATKIEEWAKGTEYYNEAVRRTRQVMQTGELKGVIWHQGEWNKDDKNYLPKLEKFISDLRSDLGMPDLPFIAGEIHVDAGKKDGGNGFNSEIAKLPARVLNTACVSAENLKLKDRWHFDSESAMILGERYAEAMMRIQKIKQNETAENAKE